MRLFDWNEGTKEKLKWLSIGAIAFGVGWLAHRAIQAHREKSKPKIMLKEPNSPKRIERINTQKSEYSDYYFDKELELRYIGESIADTPTVEEIYMTSPSLAREEFIKYTKEIRKRRRLVRKANEDQYVELILQYGRDVQELLLRSRAELLEYLNIDLNDFQDMEENVQEFQTLQELNKSSEASLYGKLVTFCPPKRMSDATLGQIIDQECSFINNKMYNRIRNKLQKDLMLNQDQILFIVETLLQDIVYEKFGYEREDITRKIQEGTNVSTLERQLAFNKMAADISEFSFDSLQSAGDEEAGENEGLKRSYPTAGRSSEGDD